MNEGYSICLNKWALDKEIKNELGLLLIISSLCAEKGYCFASNKYLSDLFNITDVSISSKINKLEKKGYITIEYQKRGCEIISRKIRLKNILTDDLKKYKSTIKENFKDNNISINNIDNNIINKEKDINKLISKKKFIKPTIEEIRKYCNDRNNGINAEVFFDFYEANGWVQGKGKPIKDWKACVRTWERNNKNNNQKETRYEREKRILEELANEEE